MRIYPGLAFFMGKNLSYLDVILYLRQAFFFANMEILFWISLFIVFYTYVGYGVLLYILVRIRRLIKGARPVPSTAASSFPSCCLIVAAYNEEDVIREKIENSLALKYPAGMLKIYFVTDGSTDRTPDIVASYSQITLLHIPERHGKIHAVHRTVTQVDAEVVVFTDANTLLNPDALLELCKHYGDPGIGAVSGEKRIATGTEADASSAGEGFYWKYESTLKKWDAELYSIVGSAGELFSIRRNLYEAVPADTILDDFMISMKIAEKGYRIIYEPQAYATEEASENVSEELKRKIRIAAGGIQSITRLGKLFNPFPHPILTFQYISHRVLRWTVTPVLLIVVFGLNAYFFLSGYGWVYTVMFFGQLLFYALAVIGFLLEKKELKVKIAFIPYYFCVMNYAVLAGIIRYFMGKQGAVWEKAHRKHHTMEV